MKCEICASDVSEPVAELFSLPSVTSDCRPWSFGRSVTICSGCGVMKRAISPLMDFDDIYNEYKSYPEPRGRTQKILEFVKGRMPLPESILDVGCGQGDGLKVLEMYFPKAKVFGYEPTICTERPKNKFDFITLFHVLEHVEDLHEMIAYIKSSLTPNGHVLIQVPYTVEGPFDLVIADHVWHFNKTSLALSFLWHGLKPIYLGNDVIKKEITLLAKLGDNMNDIHIENRGKLAIDWILSYKKFLDSVNEQVAVYGTGPAAAWAGSILGDKVSCYLDDDNHRHGTFNGKNVYYVSDIQLPVVAPFPDWQLKAIKASNPSLKFLC